MNDFRYIPPIHKTIGCCKTKTACHLWLCENAYPSTESNRSMRTFICRPHQQYHVIISIWISSSLKFDGIFVIVPPFVGHFNFHRRFLYVFMSFDESLFSLGFNSTMQNYSDLVRMQIEEQTFFRHFNLSFDNRENVTKLFFIENSECI